MKNDLPTADCSNWGFWLYLKLVLCLEDWFLIYSLGLQIPNFIKPQNVSRYFEKKAQKTKQIFLFILIITSFGNIYSRYSKCSRVAEVALRILQLFKVFLKMWRLRFGAYRLWSKLKLLDQRPQQNNESVLQSFFDLKQKIPIWLSNWDFFIYIFNFIWPNLFLHVCWHFCLLGFC